MKHRFTLPFTLAFGAALATMGACGSGPAEQATGGGGHGGSGGSGGSASLACASPADCPETGNECVMRVCLDTGACGTIEVAAGTAVASQTAGDCQKLVCDGKGGTQSVNDDADAPDDGNVCTADACGSGAPVHTPIAGDCAESGGVHCGDPAGPLAGKCIGCNVGADCPSGACNDGMCAACTADAQCGSGSICDAGTCVTAKANGDACTSGGQCASTFCVDGVCCGSACGGVCEACTAAKKGTGADGACGPVGAATDPDDECPDEGAMSCGNDGTCDGAGACHKYASGTVCAPASCAGGTQSEARSCDGAGTCGAAATSSCGAYACDAIACKTSCATSADCAPGNTCGGDGKCFAVATSCGALHAASPALPDGVYTIDPDGAGGIAPFSVYCDMTTAGGGWTLIVHTWLSGVYPPTPAFTQTFADWQTKGIGAAVDYGGPKSQSFYVMPLEPLRVLIGATASSLRFQSDNAATLAQLDGLTMNGDYGFGGTNLAATAATMCTTQATSNCFLRAPGFSSAEVHHDNNGGQCGTGIFAYQNVGYWYDSCYSTNVFATGGQYGGPTWYSGYSGDPDTQHWTWWVR